MVQLCAVVDVYTASCQECRSCSEQSLCANSGVVKFWGGTQSCRLRLHEQTELLGSYLVQLSRATHTHGWCAQSGQLQYTGNTADAIKHLMSPAVPHDNTTITHPKARIRPPQVGSPKQPTL
jgi:hypothetical protein